MPTTTITCPDCGQVSEFDGLERAADEFCSHCDYPLFWARPDGPALVAAESADTSRRRLPGAEGKLIVGGRLCPECGEQNRPGAIHCIRCDALMDPPPPEPIVIVEAAPPPPPPPPAPEPRNWWPWIAGGITVALLIILLVVWLW